MASDASAGYEVPATLAAFGAEPTPATLTLMARGSGRRVTSAVVGLLICWAAAAIAVFMPVVHFFAVPGLVVAGLAWALFRVRERRRLLGVHGRCPRCGSEQEFVPAGSRGDQFTVDCPICFTRLTARPTGSG